MEQPDHKLHLFERRVEALSDSRIRAAASDLPKRERKAARRLVPDTDLRSYVHPDELPTVEWLLQAAAQRPDFTASLSLMARDTDRWELHRFEIGREVMGPILRLAPPEAAATPPVMVLPDHGAPARLDRHGAIDLIRTTSEANPGRRIGVALIDIDRMKAQSEALGEAFGDELVDIVSARTTPGEEGIIHRRLQSDEFLILVIDTVDSRLQALAESWRRSVNEPIRFGELTVRPTCTIGTAQLDPTSDTEVEATAVYRRVETALIAGKERGRNQVAAYTPGLEIKAQQMLTTTARVMNALDQRSVRMHYQPIVSLAEGSVTGLEGLLRTERCETDDPIPAWMLVEAADEVGMIGVLNRQMLDRVSEDLDRWQSCLDPTDDFHVSLNVSAAQLHDPSFVAGLTEVTRRTGTQGWLCLELAGSASLPGRSPAFEALRRSGIPLGLDGLGSSGSTFSDLCRLPISFVKIGPDLTRWVDLDPRVKTIVGATIQAAHGLGASAVAVGVERESQRTQLRDLGCDAAQGHLFHRALDADGVAELLGPRRTAASRPPHR